MTTPMATGNVSAPDRQRYGAAGWLGLAATPTFALMAWLSVDSATMLCSASGMPPLDGMSCMYLLMSLFHLPPWLKLASGGNATDRPLHNQTEGD